ncbi:preprotein translocase subunit SecE [Candidatus Parcubacteria bacterium]|uniref:Protein translocase subunit SecE n=1 Tax=Candidatus Kaiserbacteria bacterium CG10_big_fil_rev_8_21_14_0_10_47_16 TaxID=1974608 RepID=A0A2H0UEP5_9BACT|nr:preprotein translocase subunit SecE [Candidatus Parcubacteria bacterium]PIR84861.1 MAG: preprotein translocase subunit SecE [Candidatus Kaiserbacteria bacterium CG10_big_fil_rev_8_21_14_0_10_47_16]
MNRFINYLRDTKGELKHVSWPSREQAIVYTVLVIAISVAVALFIAAFDFLFGEGLNLLIK